MFQAKLLTPVKMVNSGMMTTDPLWSVTPVVRHCYGYQVDTKHKAGELVYVDHSPASVYDAIEHEYKVGDTSHWTANPTMVHGHQFTGTTRHVHYEFGESWMVYLSLGHVVQMSTEAAKSMLQAVRDANGKVVDAGKAGEACQQRYYDELSR